MLPFVIYIRFFNFIDFSIFENRITLDVSSVLVKAPFFKLKISLPKENFVYIVNLPFEQAEGFEFEHVIFISIDEGHFQNENIIAH